MRSLIPLAACCISATLATPLSVLANEEPAFSVGGFGTLGVTYNSSREADFLRDLSQPSGPGRTRRFDAGTDSLLGIQLEATLTPSLQGAVQAISHRRYDGSFRPELTWGYVSYAPVDSVQLRAGRLGFDVYMLSDSRSIGYSYVRVRPPVEYFGSLPLSYIDGADAVFRAPVGSGIARAKLYGGIAREQVPTRFGSERYSLRGSPIVGANLEYQDQAWLYRIGYARLRFENELAPTQPLLQALRDPRLAALGPGPTQFAEAASIAGKYYGFYSAGVAYDAGPLQAHLVISRQASQSLAFPPNDAAYASLAWRNGPLTPYVGWSAIRTRATTRSTGLPAGVAPPLDALIAGASQLQQGNANIQHTVSAGLRWDVAPKMAWKLQFDRVHAEAPLMWANRQPGWNGRASVVSVAMDFVF